MNLFDSVSDDFQYILDSMGKDIQINGVNARGLITSTSINQSYDDKKIKSLELIKRGDKIKYLDEVYLITSEINGTRNGKYYGLMRKTNYVISILTGTERIDTGQTDNLGRPVYETVNTYSDEPCIVANQTATVGSTGAISLPNGNIDMIFQDNENTQKIALNNTYTFNGQSYTVIGFDKTKTGIIIVKCSLTTSN
jgi:hypothetical protein